MTEWRVIKDFHKEVTFTAMFSSPPLTLGEAFPDIDKTVIYPKLLEWGIDARKMRVEYVMERPVMRAEPYLEGRILIATNYIDRAYPTNEDKYIGLVHELAHFLQMIEGRETPTRALSPEEWIATEGERDAIWWSAMQARKMQWSKEKFLDFLKRRYHIISDYPPATISQILLYGTTGWEQQTRLPAFREFIPHRRPVHVRQYRRRK